MPGRAQLRAAPPANPTTRPLLYSPGHERDGADPGLPGPSVGGRLTRDAALAFIQRRRRSSHRATSPRPAGISRASSASTTRRSPPPRCSVWARPTTGSTTSRRRSQTLAGGARAARDPVDLHGLAQHRGGPRPRRRPDRRHRRLPRGRQASAARGQGRDRQPARLADQGDRQRARVEALLRAGPGRRAARSR